MANIHVVVECCMSVLIFVEESISIIDAKIFEVQETVRIVFANQLDEPSHLLSMLIVLEVVELNYLSMNSS